MAIMEVRPGSSPSSSPSSSPGFDVSLSHKLSDLFYVKDSH